MSCWRFALVVTVIWYENGRKSPTPKRPFHWLKSGGKGFAGYMSLLLRSTFISCVDSSSFPVNPALLLEHIRGQIIRRWRSIHPLHLLLHPWFNWFCDCLPKPLISAMSDQLVWLSWSRQGYHVDVLVGSPLAFDMKCARKCTPKLRTKVIISIRYFCKWNLPIGKCQHIQEKSSSWR